MAESFADLLRRHRVAEGLSQEALAERAGLSVDAISYLERGVRRAPQKATLDLLMDALALDDNARYQLEEAAKVARSRGPQGHGQRLIHQLPRPLTPLIGRAHDVNAVLDLLERYRLVTITGSGGVGKTRVALEVGERYAELKSTEVAFIDLSPLGHGSLVPDAIANVLGTQQDVDATTADALPRYLRNRTLLLILDNCEHVLDDVAAAAGAMLSKCPLVRLLTTSRERLDIAGEAVFRLHSLAFPSSERTTIRNAASYSALELFAERAKAGDAKFALSDENANLVADICRRLDGIPLAIELAAARLPIFGLPTLQARVSERFVLTSSGRAVPSRQATMQATIAWSYDLLHEPQRTLLNRLAIFAGGCSLDAVEFVCQGDELRVSEIAGLLASLVDKSLVNASFDTEPVRYSLLDSVRDYGLEQLAIRATSHAVARRHALWLLKTAEDWHQSGSDDIKPFLLELDNIRSALQSALSSGDEKDVLLAGRIAGAFRRLWIETGRFAEYRTWSESLIERIDENRHPEVVAPLLAGLAQVPRAGLVQVLEARAATMARIEHAISLFEGLADYVSVVHLHAELCNELAVRGQFEKAEKVGTEALQISEMHGLERSYAYVHVLGVLAESAISQRRTDEGRAYAIRALKILPPHDRRWRPWLTVILAMVEFREGNTARALELTEATWREYSDGWPGRALVRIRSNLSNYHLLLNHLDEAAAISREILADSHETFGDSIENLAAIAALRGEAVSAARVLGFLEEWRTRTEFHRNALSQATYDVLLAALREHLSEDAIDHLKAEGREMSLDQTIDDILRVTEALVS